MNHPSTPQTFARDKWEILENRVDPMEWCQRKMKLLERIIRGVKDIFFFFFNAHSMEKKSYCYLQKWPLACFSQEKWKNKWRWVKYQWCCFPARQKPINPKEVSISIKAIKPLFYNSGLSISHVKTAAALLKTLICRWDKTSRNVLYFQGKE